MTRGTDAGGVDSDTTSLEAAYIGHWPCICMYRRLCLRCSGCAFVIIFVLYFISRR